MEDIETVFDSHPELGKLVRDVNQALNELESEIGPERTEKVMRKVLKLIRQHIHDSDKQRQRLIDKHLR